MGYAEATLGESESRFDMRRIAFFLLLSLGTLFFSGCNEAEEPTKTAVSVGQRKQKKQLYIDPKSPLAKLTCQANKNTVQKAVGIFMTQKKRLPKDLAELQSSGMFQKKMRCPSGGIYTIDNRGVTSCSLHK